MVTNYEYVVSTLGLDKDKVVASLKKGLFEGKYTDQKESLINALVDGGIKTVGGNAVNKSTLNSLAKIIKDEGGEWVQQGSEVIWKKKEDVIDDWLKEHGLKAAD